MRLHRLLRLIHRLRGLTPREWGDLWRAQWHVLRAQARLRHADEGDLMKGWSAAAAPTAPGGNPARNERAHAIGDSVRRVAAFGLTRPRCLARTLAISDLLAREGISGSVIRVGVRRTSLGLEAHAWVEHHGEVIGDSVAFVSRFREFVSAQPAGR